ncbi:MAG: hypothetical protein V3U86_03940 [Acidobacteriota bacterium]|nr:hypothetical protein [Acidobacteriota bacterium]
MVSTRKRGDNMTDIIYDLEGSPVYRVLPQGRIVDFEGQSVAWIDDGRNIYDYHGMHRGWYEDGAWVGHDGGMIGFGGSVQGPCPDLPPRSEARPRARRPVREPPRPAVYFPPPRPERRAAWARRPLGSRLDLHSGH